MSRASIRICFKENRGVGAEWTGWARAHPPLWKRNICPPSFYYQYNDFCSRLSTLRKLPMPLENFITFFIPDFDFTFRSRYIYMFYTLCKGTKQCNWNDIVTPELDEKLDN